MWPYWLFFLIPALAALAEARSLAGDQTVSGSRVVLSPFVLLMIPFLTLVIGYRYEVGGDWFNYFNYLDGVAGLAFRETLSMSDPAYQVINWVSNEFGWGIFGINLISGLIFSIGLVLFCRDLSRPWLALVVAVPYLVIVVGMGYSRQGVALGLAMIGFLSLQKGSMLRFVFWIMLAAAFHKTAVVLIPIAAMAYSQSRIWAIFWAVSATMISYTVFLADEVEHLYVNYVEAEYQSSGTFIRLAMNVVPALLLLRYREYFDPNRRTLWIWFALVSLGLFVLFFLSPSSTAVDRIALYMLPLQLYVFSSLPAVMNRVSGMAENTVVTAVLIYYAVVQIVWLNFADHAFAWLPYRFYPLENLF